MTITTKEWVEALRSGKYEQGNQRLRTGDNRFCCLGVLCDLVDPTRWTKDAGWVWHGKSFLPPTGIFNGIGGLDEKIAGVLANANDRGASFDQIADALEIYADGRDFSDLIKSLDEFLSEADYS